MALAVLPPAVRAQPADSGPKLLARGTNSTQPAGPGAVTVKVFVKKDGTFNVIDVLKTTNPGDNAAALEIAKTSSYKPAIRNGQPSSEFYDYALTFGGDAAAVGSSPIAAAINALNAGDNASAAADFDRAGTIPDQYKALAAQVYAKNASAQLGTKDYAGAGTSAGQAIALDPQSLQGYYYRGIAEANTQKAPAAVADLQKALALAESAKSDDKTLGAISFNLAVAQLDSGQFAAAAATAKDVARYDPDGRARLDSFVVSDEIGAAQDAVKRGAFADGVSGLESGAVAFPSVSGSLLAEAAAIMTLDKDPDWKRVRAEADKALAADPHNGEAAYVGGVAASRLNDTKGALAYMNEAKASPVYATDAGLAKKIDDALKVLNAPQK
jgi:tetratricopeptide (TPR) repeat protein